MLPIEAVAIYGETTKSFRYQWLMLDDPDEPQLTAYGVHILTPQAGDNQGACYICDDRGTPRLILTEHGATGSPVQGVPAHLHCQLDGEGILVSRDQVRFVDPEPPLLTELERKFLKTMMTGYRAVVADLGTQYPSIEGLAQLKVWDSLAAKLKL